MATPSTAQPETTGAVLEYQGKTLGLPVVTGTEAESAIDIQALRAKTGLITLDPGFGNSGSCRSAITFIDGDQGILRYRGYDIAELAEKSTFLEVAWLLINGELPGAGQLSTFENAITHHSLLHENFRNFYNALPKDAHPMPVCMSAVATLAAFYQQPESDDVTRENVVRLIAKMPTIAAWTYKHLIGQPFVYPRNDLDYSANFLHMMFATPAEPYHVDPVLAKAVDQMFILHADHEQNCSTSTVRMVGSSRANVFASVAAGIGALWGPLHGGANQQVIEMLERIDADGGDVQKFVDRAKDKKDNSRLMGFGHRVYKNYDPRAALCKQTCNVVLNKLGMNNRLLEIAMKLEEIALHDEYFISHKLYPNVDFYSGIIFKALGIPIQAFTVMFTIGRLPGWIAHFLEMRKDPDTRIARPRQIYTGATQRPYVPLEARR
jgi:citrate synthase